MSLAAPFPVTRSARPAEATITPSLIPARLAMAILWQGRWFLLVSILLACTFAFVVRKLVPPDFPAQVQVFVDPAGLDLIDTQNNRADQAADMNLYQVETIRHFIRSAEVLMPVVTALELDRDAEFTDPGPLAAVRRALTGGGSLAADPGRAMEELRRKTAVQRLELSFVLEIVALSQEPDKAARIANALAASMRREAQARQAARLREAQTQFSQRRQALSAELEKAENRVADARASGNRIGSERETVLEQQLRETGESLAAERLRRLEAASRLARVQAALTPQQKVDVALALEASPNLSQWQRDLAQAQARLLDLQTRLGARHPQVTSQQARLESLRQQMMDEANRLIETVKSDHAAAVASEQALLTRFEQLKAEQKASASQSIAWRESLRKAESLGEASQALRHAEGRAEIRRTAGDDLFRVIADATLPTSPWRLGSSKALPLVALAAFCVATALLLLSVPLPTAPVSPLMTPRPVPPLVVILFVTFTVIMATSAFYPLMAQKTAGEIDSGSTARGNLGYVLVWVALYGAAGWLILRDMLMRGIDRGLLGALPLIGFIMLSAMWSDRPTDAAYFSVMLCANILIAYALVQMTSAERFLRLVAQVTVVLLILSLVFLAVDPARALSFSDGRGWFITKEFSGLFSHKLHSGTYAAMALMLMVFVFPRPLRGVWLVLGCGVSVVTMALANSATAVVAVVLVSGLMLIGHWTRSFRLVLGAGIGFLAFSVLAPMVNLGSATQLVGRDANLTGRGSFWKLAWDLAAERPFGGYGYTTFFDRNAFSPVWRIYDFALDFFTPNFHNSSLDIVISFGLIGLALYLVLALSALFVVRNDSLAPATRMVLVGLMIFFTISSTFDFQFLRHNSLPTIMLFYVFFISRRDCRDHGALRNNRPRSSPRSYRPAL